MAEITMIDRALYKRIKGMNREEMSGFIQEIYSYGVRDSVIDLDELRERIGQIKGIGDSRLDDIMKVIEDVAINNGDEA